MIFISNYLAIIPFYGENGSNRTRIIYSDGTDEVLDTPIKHHLYTIFLQLNLDRKSLQFWTHKILGSKSNIPLTFTDAYVFIPVKVRQSYGKTDGCFGYVLSSAITNYSNFQLTLLHHTSLSTRSPQSYITKKLRDAKLLAYAYTDERKQYEFLNH